MEPVRLVLLALAAFLGWGALGWWLIRRLRSLLDERKDEASLLLIHQQIDRFRGRFGQALDNNSQLVQQQLGQVLGHVNDRPRENAETFQHVQQSLGERLDNATRDVGQVQKNRGGLEEANRQIFDVGKDIASLQEIPRAPELRGGLGEFFLADLLAQILPPDHFFIECGFKTGE